jgi:hypothetical protein
MLALSDAQLRPAVAAAFAALLAGAADEVRQIEQAYL